MTKLPLCIFLLSSFTLMAQNKESKKLHHTIEVGSTFANFMDGRGFHYMKQKSQIAITSAVYARYTYFFAEKWGGGLQYYWFGRTYYPSANSSYQKGDLIRRYYRCIGLEAKYSVFSSKLAELISLKAILGTAVHYRYAGKEDIFLQQISSWESKTDGTGYNSMGVGINADISLVVHKHWLLGLDFGYQHFFQKPGLRVEPPTSAFYQSYKPNRDVLAFHPKIGFLF